MNTIVGIGDCRVESRRDVTLITYALGSCVAVVVHDAIAGVGGLLHFMLPESNLDPDKAHQNPYLFADTGIPLLFRSAYDLGADRRRIHITLAGGAQMMEADDHFNIGRRNCVAVRSILAQAGLMAQTEALAGSVSRTVRLDVSSGRVFLKENGGLEHEIAPMACHDLARKSCEPALAGMVTRDTSQKA
jgi:chemotaxis protein CheD